MAPRILVAGGLTVGASRSEAEVGAAWLRARGVSEDAILVEDRSQHTLENLFNVRELLRAEGKQPCRNAPAYLAGLMAQVPEDQMPEELRNKDLVAAEPAVFAGGSGRRCFLYVSRRDGCRGLSLTIVDGKWDARWAFLAEDLVP